MLHRFDDEVTVYSANRSSPESTVNQPTLERVVVEGQHAQHAERARVDSLRTATVMSMRVHSQREPTLFAHVRSFNPPVAQLMKADRSGMRQFA